jgi:ADP-ribose pyrophosphatase
MSPPRPIPPHPDLDLLSDETVWDGRFALQRIRFRHRRFDGAMSGVLTWELWRRGGAVAVLPYDPRADRVVLIEQFRLPALAAGVNPVMTEIVAGLGEPGEAQEVTARRELREETGLACGRLELVTETLLMQGGCDESIAIYVAEVTAPAENGTFGLVAEEENIRVKVMPAPTAIAAATSLGNATGTLALLWLAANRDRLRREWA